MHLVTTLVGREVAKSALDICRGLSMDRAALDRRLELSERAAKDVLNTIGYLESLFSEVPDSDTDDVVLELKSQGAAKVLRMVLVQWAAAAPKKDKSAHQLTLMTDLDQRMAAGQKMIDQLHDQLSLPIEDISALADASLGKKAREKSADDDDTGTLDLAGDVSDDDPD